MEKKRILKKTKQKKNNTQTKTNPQQQWKKQQEYTKALHNAGENTLNKITNRCSRIWKAYESI